MITIYRIFISTHFIKRVIKAFTWNEKLNYDISDVTNLVSSPYHAANKCLIFCFLGFYLLLYIFIGHFFFLIFLHFRAIFFIHISCIFLCRALQISLHDQLCL